MRKMILELSEKEVHKLPNSPLNVVKSNEFLHIIRFDDKEFAAIIRMEFKDASFNIAQIISYSGLIDTKIELLEQETDNRFTFFVKGIFPNNTRQQKLASFGGFFLTPFEIVDGKIRMTFIGKPKQLKALIKICEEISLNYKVVLLTDATFANNTPLASLTNKQKDVLTTSFKEGYYDIPRRTGSKEIALKLGLKGSAFIEHRRKAEQRLIAAILNETKNTNM
jgi:predicted DNA binding protein